VRFCAAKSSAGARVGEKREREEVASITTRKGSCGICDWQTSTLQPSQGITTQILNLLFGMATLYMENSFQTYVYCFHRTSGEIVLIQESQAVIEDSARHTAVLFRATACFILVQSVHKTYEKVSFDERVIGTCFALF
jgi:hypothetical protein